MIEVLNNRMVYVTVDERNTVERLFRVKPEAAIYYKNGKKIAYHWILNPITIGKMKIKAQKNAYDSRIAH